MRRGEHGQQHACPPLPTAPRNPRLQFLLPPSFKGLWGQTLFTCRAATDSALKAVTPTKTTWLVQPLRPGAGHLPAGSYLENEAAGLLALRLNPIHLWTDLCGAQRGTETA